MSLRRSVWMYFFFFNDTATTEIYTLSLHDALPICAYVDGGDDSALGNLIADALKADATIVRNGQAPQIAMMNPGGIRADLDRKSTRLNSSHANISYAVFCLKKKQHLLLYSHNCHID